MITLRPYQEKAFKDITQASLEEQFLLLQAATGAGKTIFFSELIKRLQANYQGMRIGVVAHREILVRQAYEKLCQVWPEAEFTTGLACKSVSDMVDLNRPVVIGSPQTITPRLGIMPPLHLAIIDEAHRVPGPHKESQYGDLIKGLLTYNPQMRILGVTATPYQLNHGYIYGPNHHPEHQNWFPRLHSAVTIAQLIEEGYLVPYICREAVDIRADLESVKKSAGEFNLNDLGDLMGREVHIKGAVEAYQKWGEQRQHVVVFCVTIEHAERVKEAFSQAGYKTGVIHSRMTKEARRRALNDFDQGHIQIIANVGVLTEGWDCTSVDCILFCRPTLSPALYVQMLGRGLRLHLGKENLLCLDLSSNCRRHGDPNDPHVTVPSDRRPRSVDDMEAPTVRICPQCGLANRAGAMECIECGYTWEQPQLVEQGAPQDMKELNWSAMPAHIIDWWFEDFTSTKGNRMIRLNMITEINGVDYQVNEFLDIEGQGSFFGKEKAQRFWDLFGKAPIPKSMDEAMDRLFGGEITTMPQDITLKKNGKYWNVVRWN